MKIKDGVIMAGLRLQMRQAIMAANQIWAEHGKELVITSALDGEHSASSLHYYGFAVDVRTRYFDNKELDDVVFELSRRLRSIDIGYRTVLHNTHLHIEWRGLIADDIYNKTMTNLHKDKRDGTSNLPQH